MTRALLKQALVALEYHKQQTRPIDTTDIAIEAIRAELAKPAPYDQTALELCETCGWKTLIPGEGCLNCERSSQPAWHDAPSTPGI